MKEQDRLTTVSSTEQIGFAGNWCGHLELINYNLGNVRAVLINVTSIRKFTRCLTCDQFKGCQNKEYTLLIVACSSMASARLEHERPSQVD